MKKIITICLVIAAVFMGGVSLEAKTTKKKTAGTTQTTKKKSTSTSKAFPVAGKSYELRNSNAYGYSVIQMIFKENGNGTIHVYVNAAGMSDSDSMNFTWKQNGNKVTIYDSSGHPDVLTVVNGGKGLKNSNGQVATLAE